MNLLEKLDMLENQQNKSPDFSTIFDGKEKEELLRNSSHKMGPRRIPPTFSFASFPSRQRKA